MTNTTKDRQLVSSKEISDLLGVARATVYQWQQRGLLPEPDYILGIGPVWWKSTVERWARKTGRIQ